MCAKRSFSKKSQFRFGTCLYIAALQKPPKINPKFVKKMNQKTMQAYIEKCTKFYQTMGPRWDPKGFPKRQFGGCLGCFCLGLVIQTPASPIKFDGNVVSVQPLTPSNLMRMRHLGWTGSRSCIRKLLAQKSAVAGECEALLDNQVGHQIYAKRSKNENRQGF